jgi:hypothetical protein
MSYLNFSELIKRFESGKESLATYLLCDKGPRTWTDIDTFWNTPIGPSFSQSRLRVRVA